MHFDKWVSLFCVLFIAMMIEPLDLKAQSSAKAPALLVKGFKIQGNTQLHEDRIQQRLAAFTGKELSVGQLYDAADTVTKIYQDSGYFMSKAYLPPQTIKDGYVTLLVDEGHWNQEVKIENSGRRVKSSLVSGMIKHAVKRGEVLESKNFERGLMLVNDIPSISARGVVHPPKKPGEEGSLSVKVDDGKRIEGYTSYDNFGSPASGRHRSSTFLTLNSPTKNGETLDLQFVTSGERFFYGYSGLKVPVGTSGLKAGGSLALLYYEMDNSGEENDGDGTSLDGRFNLEYPFIRSQTTHLTGSIEYAHLKMKDRIQKSKTDDKDLDYATAELSADKSDDLFAGGKTNFSFSGTAGHVGLNDYKPYKEDDADTANTQGTFGRLNGALSRNQAWMGPWSSLFSVSGQLGIQNLDSSQQFSMGGPDSLPGYPVGEAYGDSGALFYSDLRYHVPKPFWKGDFQISAICSSGWMHIHNHTWSDWKDGNPIIKNSFFLSSVGMGLNQSWWDQKFVIRAVLGWQVGAKNPMRQMGTGDASDSGSSGFRGWLQSVLYF